MGVRAHCQLLLLLDLGLQTSPKYQLAVNEVQKGVRPIHQAVRHRLQVQRPIHKAVRHLQALRRRQLSLLLHLLHCLRRRAEARGIQRRRPRLRRSARHRRRVRFSCLCNLLSTEKSRMTLRKLAMAMTVKSWQLSSKSLTHYQHGKRANGRERRMQKYVNSTAN